MLHPWRGAGSETTMPLTLLEPVSQTQAGPRWIFGDMNRPACARSERDWLRQGYRVPDSAEPVAVLHHILKTPHSRSRPALVPQDQAEEAWLRQRGLRRFEVQGPHWRRNWRRFARPPATPSAGRSKPSATRSPT